MQDIHFLVFDRYWCTFGIMYQVPLLDASLNSSGSSLSFSKEAVKSVERGRFQTWSMKKASRVWSDWSASLVFWRWSGRVLASLRWLRSQLRGGQSNRLHEEAKKCWILHDQNELGGYSRRVSNLLGSMMKDEEAMSKAASSVEVIGEWLKHPHVVPETRWRL